MGCQLAQANGPSQELEILECVANDLAMGFLPGSNHDDNVETGFAEVEFVVCHEVARCTEQSQLFLVSDGASRGNYVLLAPRPYLDEHKRSTLPGNEIDFSSWTAVVPGNDAVTSGFEEFRCNFLAPCAGFDSVPPSVHGSL
jgi:hypothetical protein